MKNTHKYTLQKIFREYRSINTMIIFNNLKFTIPIAFNVKTIFSLRCCMNYDKYVLAIYLVYSIMYIFESIIKITTLCI